MNKKISVLIPVFNRQDYIKEAIDSILNQSYKNFELIIYNDGSIDNTVPIIRKLAKIDNRIKIIGSKINKGGVYAKIQLIKESKTDIICYQDSDDISHLKRLEKQLLALKSNDIVFCDWKWMYKIRGKRYYRKANSKCSASIMFKKDINILPNPNFHLGGGDIDFINRYIKKHPKLIIVPEVLYYVRSHNDRIGIWKLKFAKKIPKHLIKTLSYKELLHYYKEHYE